MKIAVNEHILKVHFPPISEVKGWLAAISAWSMA
jgi:hypothetical protein